MCWEKHNCGKKYTALNKPKKINYGIFVVSLIVLTLYLSCAHGMVFSGIAGVPIVWSLVVFTLK